MDMPASAENATAITMNLQLLRVIMTQVCLWCTVAGTRLAVPLLALKQGFGVVPVGLLMGLFALTQIFLALPAGRFADRRGVRLPVTLSTAASGLGVCAAALFPVFPVLCLAALLTGGSAGVTMIATQRHVGLAAGGPAQLKQAFSWLAIAPAVGNFLGPFSAGMLIDHAGTQAGDLPGFRIAFAALLGFPLSGWLLVRGVHEVSAPARPDAGSATRTWDILRIPTFRRLLFVNWLQGCSWDAHVFAVPLLCNERGLSASAIGTIMGVFAIATALVRVGLPWVAARADERAIIGASTLSTGALFAIYPLLPSALAMAACSAMLGFALGAVQPMVMTLMHRVTPPGRHGEALGLRLLFLTSSSVAMPVAFGAAGAVVGIAGVFWIVAAVLGAGTPAVRGLHGSGRSHHEGLASAGPARADSGTIP
jgi:MFS family permease